MPALNFKYFDEGTSQWGMRRPPTTTQASRTFSILCVSIGTRGPSEDVASKVSKLADLVSANSPTFIILNEVTQPFHNLLKDNPTIRGGYGVTDFSANQCNVLANGGSKPIEQTSCFLIAHYVPVPFAEHNIKSDFNSDYKSRPFAVVYIRGFLGLQFAIGALHFDPLNIVGTRVSAISKCLEKVDPSESPVALMFANYLESTSSALRTELPIVLDKLPNFHWSDVQKLQLEPVEAPREPCGLWMRQNDANPVVVQSCTVLPSEDQFGYCALTYFRAGDGQSPSSGITIPQPRSAKVEPKVEPKSNATPMNFDPAVVSIDKSPGSLPASAAQQRQAPFPTQPTRTRKWFADRTTHIRRAPDNDERDYDLNMYKTVDEAVAALNSSFRWNFDYFIVGSNLLYCEGAKPSYPAFKRYCVDHVGQMNQWRRENNLPTGKAARLAAQRQPAAPLDVGSDDNVTSAGPTPTTLSNNTPPARQDFAPPAPASTIPPTLAAIGNTIPSATISPPPIAAVSPNAPNNKHLPARQRVWSEHCASIVYQTTPLEMRFDISAHVGQAKTNLATAIERLNSRNKKADASGKPDPLATYSYDYALLFNSERQGYWLIACTDVPCDMVACRNYSYRLTN